MIDVVLLLIFLLVAWCVASEGACGAGWMVVILLFSGLLAMNLFEPFAGMLEGIFKSPSMRLRLDVISLVGLFTIFTLVMRLLVEQMTREFMGLHPTAEGILKWTCGALCGYITMAFLLTALHTAPLPREFWGFTPERKNFLTIAAPDRQWLGFTQYVSEKTFKRGPQGRIFDGPRITMGGQTPYPNEIWPSFPIRYASRREASANPAAQVQTENAPAPTSPGRSAGPEF